jgi:protein-tyrosine phosphatase
VLFGGLSERIMGTVGSQIVQLDNGAEIYLGTLKASENEYLNAKDVRHVVNCAEILPHMTRWNRRVLEMEANGTLKVMRMKWKDERKQKLTFLEPLRFVHGAVLQGQGVLIHCEQGKSRSGSVMIAYLMAAYGMNLQAALTFVKERRSIVHPNSGFMKQLSTFETSLELTQLRGEFLGGPQIVLAPPPLPDVPVPEVPKPTPEVVLLVPPPITMAPPLPPSPPPKLIEDGFRSLKEGLKQLQHQLYHQQLSEEGFESAVSKLKLRYLDALL